MRLIGSVASQQQAELLVAWLIAERIEVHVDPNGSQWELWAKDEDQLQVARQAYQDFLADPGHERYRAARERAAAVIQERKKKRQTFARNYVDVRRRGGRTPAPLTWTLIVVSCLVALLTSFGRPDQFSQPTFTSLAMLAVPPPRSGEVLDQYAGDTSAIGLKFTNIASGQFWRLFTPMFIHFGPMHLIFNMIWLYQLGRMIEGRYGTFRYGLLILATAALSNFCQAAVPPSWGGLEAGMGSGYLLVALGGMSGVCYGLFGLVWIMSLLDRGSGFYLPQSTVVIMLGWMFFCMSPWSERYLGAAVANWAHAIGLLVGMGTAYVSVMLKRRRK